MAKNPRTKPKLCATAESITPKKEEWCFTKKLLRLKEEIGKSTGTRFKTRLRALNIKMAFRLNSPIWVKHVKGLKPGLCLSKSLYMALSLTCRGLEVAIMRSR